MICASGETRPTVPTRLFGGMYPGRKKLNTDGEYIGVCASWVAGSVVVPFKKRPSAERALKVRIHCTKRTAGSRNLPLVPVAGERASTSSSTARMTAFMSPRTPCPLLLNAAATRVTYPDEGLLDTNRWINCLPKNGPTLG